MLQYKRSGWARVRIVLAAFLSWMLILAYVPNVRVALADCHDTLQHLFRKEGGSGANADGVISTNAVKDRGLNGDCLSAAESHSTAHIKNSVRTKFVEVGWHEDWLCGMAGCFHDFNIFWEVQNGNQLVGNLGNGPGINCCGNIKFKIRNVEGTQKWEMFFDYPIDGNWTQVGPSAGQDANFGEGIPYGETARRGGVKTGASDKHWNLSRKLCGSCSYFDWQTNVFASDEISNWTGVFLTNTSYEVVKD